MRAILLLVIFSISTAFAQLPGDFNCDGRVNGIDVSRYVQETRCCIFNPIDTSSCFWHNGDSNCDNLYCSNADVLQLYWYFRGYPYVDNPPLPGVVDTIMIGNVTGSPGSTVEVPMYLCSPETLGSAELNIEFTNLYLHNPTLIPLYPFSFGDHTPISDTNIVIWGVGNDTINPGHNLIGFIRFEIDENAPIGERITINLISGWYYPSGFVAISNPAYFVRPKLRPGRVLIEQSDIDDFPIPEKLSLNIYPNPFNSQANIEFTLANESNVRIEILDLLGRVIDTPIDGRYAAGNYSAIWNATERSSGVYFCRFRTDTSEINRRLTLLK
jgi:hypothetical protein